MTKRILLAGVLGGFALFLWGSISHLALGLGRVGIRELPQEEAVLNPLRASITQPGFYFFPGMNLRPGASPAEKQAAEKDYEQRYKTGPYGILIFHPQGTVPMSPRQLLVELGLNVGQALLAAWLLSLVGLSRFGPRVGFIVCLGVLAAFTTNIEYWNWYGFPGNYTTAYIFDKIVGFLVVGLVVASVVRVKAARPVLVASKAA
jgi:hypothetical protein